MSLLENYINEVRQPIRFTRMTYGTTNFVLGSVRHKMAIEGYTHAEIRELDEFMKANYGDSWNIDTQPSW